MVETLRHRRVGRLAVIVLAAVFVFYALSIGPSMFMVVYFPRLVPTYNAIYYPLGKAARAVGAGDILQRYCNFWFGLAEERAYTPEQRLRSNQKLPATH
jgi:hypothetical protein